MSCAHDMGHDIPPDFGEDYDEGTYGRETKCKYCGSTSVEWEHQEGAMGGRGSWALFDYNGTPHAFTCIARNQSVIKSGDFDPDAIRKINMDGMRTLSRRECESEKPDQPANKSTRATKKKDKLMRTMYDNHEGVNGTLPICMMDDDHLRNTIRIIAGHFNEARNQGLNLARGTHTQDPMVKSIVKQKVWNEQELEERTNNLLRHIAPYVLEACVRGEGVMEEARIAMQLVTMRQSAVPGNPLQIVHEELP